MNPRDPLSRLPVYNAEGDDRAVLEWISPTGLVVIDVSGMTADRARAHLLATAEAPYGRGNVLAGSFVLDEWGALHNYATGAYLRPATVAERDASAAAAELDGGAGVIKVGGVSCYVVD